ncbi:unnamed protein product [Vitrella brassicaformis CCMP3155]|uniref:Peptidase M20 dimerisation domain-containing protein n=2 Tax=Vitrella brassicaformis TaxID=1169539 RepID=A0A0G4F6C6_VITBC|nr:unnamed protein product [Vitrella brassicaformis CCMP3155]|eukprot:CEM07815.1 unnamed protein product [Vitrella brassicaformis CCMP3155]
MNGHAATNLELESLLESTPVWKNFKIIANIPRPSKHEGRILQFLKSYAEKHKLTFVQDKAGNVVIRRAGSGGGENAPTVVIQGHVDMVTEKNADRDHDFFNDPIKLVKSSDDWLGADGTTLGADNGVGCAMALALLAAPADAKLPPLECLFTVDEETGLNGARDLDPAILTGKYMLNLDSESWGEVTVGCAGGGDTRIVMPVTLERLHGDWQISTLRIAGLKGGHSGINIHEDRGNAVKLLARVLAPLISMHGVKAVDIGGGDKRNAIAREASAVIAVRPSSSEAVDASVRTSMTALTQEYGLMEPDMTIEVTPSSEAHPSSCLSSSSAFTLVNLLRVLPHGVQKTSHSVAGVPETSNNVASIKRTDDSAYTIGCSSRSFHGCALQAIRDDLAVLARQFGAIEVDQPPMYPGWPPNNASELLKITESKMKSVLGREPHVVALHAGLECGVLGEKLPGMDMVSFGPTITGAHSPDERVQISTVQPCLEVVCRILEEIADKRG